MTAESHGWAARVAVLLLVSVTATAAEVHAEADGFKVGDGRLHPSVETEAHHVQNPGYLPRGDATSDVFLLGRAKAGLDFPSERLEWKVDGELEYRRYLDINQDGTGALSTPLGRVATSLHVNKDRPLALRVLESLSRYADSGNQTIVEELRHVTNDAGLGVDYEPGGGALRFNADYRLTYDYYDRGQETVVEPATLDTLRHLPSLTATWKFLPRTAVLLQADGVLTTYPGGGSFAGQGRNVPTYILLAYLGATGSVTSRISALVKVGYGDTFLATPDNYRSVVGQAEGTYELGASGKVTAGYLRRVEPASFFKYFGVDRVYARYEQLFFGHTRVAAGLSFDRQRYGVDVLTQRSAPETTARRLDGNFVGSFTADHALRDWLTVSLVEQLNWRASNYTPAISGGKNVGYFYNDLFLRFTVNLDGVAAAVGD